MRTDPEKTQTVLNALKKKLKKGRSYIRAHCEKTVA